MRTTTIAPHNPYPSLPQLLPNRFSRGKKLSHANSVSRLETYYQSCADYEAILNHCLICGIAKVSRSNYEWVVWSCATKWVEGTMVNLESGTATKHIKGLINQPITTKGCSAAKRCLIHAMRSVDVEQGMTLPFSQPHHMVQITERERLRRYDTSWDWEVQWKSLLTAAALPVGGRQLSGTCPNTLTSCR